VVLRTGGEMKRAAEISVVALGDLFLAKSVHLSPSTLILAVLKESSP